MAKASVKSSDLESKLARLPLALRGKVLQKSAEKSVLPVAKALRSTTPKGGPRTGEKSGKKHLKQTITRKGFDWPGGAGAIAGARYPEGAHFHLIDRGFTHTSGAQIPGRNLVIKAMQSTTGQVQSTFDSELEKLIKNA